jgi:hypothetical protein
MATGKFDDWWESSPKGELNAIDQVYGSCELLAVFRYDE